MDRRLKIINLPIDSTPEEVSILMRPYGRVRDVKIPLNSITKRPMGVAILEMETDEMTELALQNLNGQVYRNHPLAVVVTTEPYTEIYRYFMTRKSVGEKTRRGVFKKTIRSALAILHPVRQADSPGAGWPVVKKPYVR